jgi:hypothetical protein
MLRKRQGVKLGECTLPSGAFAHGILAWPLRIEEFREFLRFLKRVARSYVFKLPAGDSFDKAEHGSQTDTLGGQHEEFYFANRCQASR